MTPEQLLMQRQCQAVRSHLYQLRGVSAHQLRRSLPDQLRHPNPSSSDSKVSTTRRWSTGGAGPHTLLCSEAPGAYTDQATAGIGRKARPLRRRGRPIETHQQPGYQGSSAALDHRELHGSFITGISLGASSLGRRGNGMQARAPGLEVSGPSTCDNLWHAGALDSGCGGGAWAR